MLERHLMRAIRLHNLHARNYAAASHGQHLLTTTGSLPRDTAADSPFINPHMQGSPQGSPRGSASPRTLSRPSSALVGPLAERQTGVLTTTGGELDRALMPRRTIGPDISILGAEAGLGALIDTTDMRWVLCMLCGASGHAGQH